MATSPSKHRSVSASSRPSGRPGRQSRRGGRRPAPAVLARRSRSITSSARPSRSVSGRGRHAPRSMIVGAARQHRLGGAFGVHGTPVAFSSTVDMSLQVRVEVEHRLSAGVRAARGSSRTPAVRASSSNAISVGSPVPRLRRRRRVRRWCSSGRRAGQQRAISRGRDRRDASPFVEIDRAAGSPDRGDPHPVLGERAGLVRADHRRRTQRLDGRQPLDDRAAAGEIAHADRQRERDGGQQPSGRWRRADRSRS